MNTIAEYMNTNRRYTYLKKQILYLILEIQNPQLPMQTAGESFFAGFVVTLLIRNLLMTNVTTRSHTS